MAKTSLSVAGLFAGIGGLEYGLKKAGHHAELLCEIDEAASRVLATHFKGVELKHDVREVRSLPKVDMVTAGFPCQDLSQAGRTAGIQGKKSGLVGEVFRLIRSAKPTWLLLENVPFMLSLDKGAAMKFLVEEIESLGYRWAYRVVDSRAFGLPQRRRRVLFLASKTEDPAPILFTDEAGEPEPVKHKRRVANGFYWTEGSTGLGWAVDAVPTLKSGSTLGIPSPPAIWLPDDRIVTPEIRDAERLQGFDENWTACWSDSESPRMGPRWKMVGNAVSVPVAHWVGERLASGGKSVETGPSLASLDKWPTAAVGSKRSGRFAVARSEWPRDGKGASLTNFLKHEGKPLSRKATAGFLKRARASSLKFQDGFLDAVQGHLSRLV